MGSEDKRQEDESEKGEGNREADRHYRDRTREFVESGRADEAAEKARNQDPEAVREAEEAEEQGRRRAKEMDPEVHRDYDKPTREDD